MQISDGGLALIKSFEGYHRKLPDGGCVAYRCPANVLTIGFGCTVGVTEGLIWTEKQAEDAFRSELSRFEAAVSRLVTVELNQHQYDALVSFAYNCGEGALAKSSILANCNRGNHDAAAKSFAAWNRGGGHVLPGLVRRRAAEAALYLEPAPTAEPAMPQAVDPPEQKEEHATAHAALEQASALYSAHGSLIRWGVAGAGAAMAFLKEHALEIAVVALAGVVTFELLRYAQRTRAMRRGTP